MDRLDIWICWIYGCFVTYINSAIIEWAGGLVGKGVQASHCDSRVWGSIPSSDHSLEP